MGTILVTGATGFLGQVLVPRLLADGHAVRVLERRPCAAFDGLAVERVTGDVTQADSLAAACAGAAQVIHMAGLVSHAEADRERLMQVNVGGTENVLAAARAAGAGRVVHVSSIAAVGTTPDPAVPLDEESPYSGTAASFPYTLSKRLCEQAALAAAAAGQEVVVANPGHVLGAGDVNGISTFHIRKILTGELRMTLPGGITYVDVHDVVDGIVRVLGTGRTGRRYILATSDGLLSHVELSRRVLALAGIERRTFHVPGAAAALGGRLAQRLRIPLPIDATELDSARYWWFCSSDRAIAELGYAPHPIDEALRATIDWYRDRGDL
ncbi:MAG: NAD-dependent epimerase/dehydratase family protein [Gaiellales bacterium]